MKLKEWFKLILIILISTFLFGVLIMWLPKMKILGGSSDGWLGYWGGIIGSMVGVLGAYSIMNKQLNEEKNTRKKEKESILVVGSNQYSDVLMQRGKNIFDKEYIKSDRKVEECLTVPLINGGQTPVFNIRIMCELVNHSNIYLVFQKYSDENFTIKDYPADGVIQEGIIYTTKTASSIIPKKTRPFDIPVILPGNQENIDLNNAFMLMINYYFFNIFGNLKFKEEKIPNPIVKVNIIYEDYELKEIEKEFYIVLSRTRKKIIGREAIKADFSLVQMKKYDYDIK